MGKLEKWFDTIESAQQLLDRTSFLQNTWIIRAPLNGCSIAKICNTKWNYYSSDAKKIRTGWTTGAQQNGRPSLPFFEDREKTPDVRKKIRDCVHLLVKFFIENVVLGVSKKTTSTFLPAESFFVFLTKCLSKCSRSTKPPLPWKISGCAPVSERLFNVLSLIISGKHLWWQ